MTRQPYLDTVLTAWLSEGGERAPERHVAAALDQVAITRQRRTWWTRNERQWSLATIGVGALLVTIVGIGISVGVGLIRVPLPSPTPGLVPSPEATPNPRSEPPAAADHGELVAYVDPGRLFDMRMPRAWAGEPVPGTAGDVTRTLSFGVGSGGGTTSSPGLRIFIGNHDGTIAACATCPEATVRTLDDLEDIVVSTPSFFTDGPPESHEALTLGGEPARSEAAGIANNCLGCPDAYFHIFTIHSGRPVVLAFDYWNVRFERITVPGGPGVPFTRATLDEMLASFRFLDVAAANEDGTFVGPDGSFQIAMPSGWQLDTGMDASALYLRGDRDLALSIRSGVAGGMVRTCDTGAPSFERCVAITASTVDDLVAGLAVPRHADPPTMWQGPLESDITLDGEPAVLMTMIGSDHAAGGMRPASLAYVVAMHEGRPFIIRAYRPDGEGIDNLPSLVEGFTFR